MFSRTAFMAGRTPPVPEDFPESATAHEKQKEENEEEAQSLFRSHSPLTLRASRPPSPRPRFRDLIDKKSSNPIGENASPGPLESLAEARARQLIEEEGLNQDEKISSVAAEGARYIEMAQKLAVEEATDPNRRGLFKKFGEIAGEDTAEVTIDSMSDIEHSDEAMIARVKDLLGPSVSGEDIVIGAPFTVEHQGSMAIIDDESLCAILVTTQSDHGKVKVADIANLKKKRLNGYGQINTGHQQSRDSRIILVKRGQNAVVEGRPTLRLFSRVQPGTAEDVALTVCKHAWTFRDIMFPWDNIGGDEWRECFT